MPRIRPVDPAQAEAKSRMLLEKITAASGRVPNILATMAHSPAALQGYLNFKNALAGGVLSHALQEKIALLAAEINRCEYCVAAHLPVARKAGLDDQAIDAARCGHSDDPKEAAALRLADRMIRRHGHVTDAEFSAARAAGLSDAELTEVVAQVALNIYTNYFNDVAEVEIDFPKVELNPPMND